ncbi:helix-turn-helix domain-containing protein [Streptomyces sp. NPDC059649]|uniref:AraC-like ligand-binding domain-containing protein n=1 Tax=Streptomyces sp. NPDC059649 TaxID=3346895 RepID=UPI0036CD6F67
MLSGTEFRSAEAAPATGRFDSWREHLHGSYVPVDLLPDDHMADFRATHLVLNLGAVRLWRIEHPPMRMRRSPQLIRRSDPELLHLSLPLRGTKRVVQSDREAGYGAHELALLDTSRPYLMEASTGERQRTVRGTGILLPRNVLPLAAKGGDALVNRRLSAREGAGALLARFLTQVWADRASYRPADGPRLGTIAIDLLSALLAHTLDAENTLAPETRRRSLVLRIQEFIQQRLFDPELTPRSVAAAHHISVSYLHRLFEDEEITVAAWIRRRRLERACRDLADPALRHTPIHAIAMHWGFARADDFTRAFRAVYGMPPRDYRYGACRVADQGLSDGAAP